MRHRPLGLLLCALAAGGCGPSTPAKPAAAAPPTPPTGATGPAAATSPTGEVYRSIEGRFSVTFPAGEVTRETEETDGLLLTSVMVDSEDGVFSVQWTDLPQQSLAVRSAAQIVDSVEAARRKEKRAILERHELLLRGAPARSVVWTNDEPNLRIHSLIVLSGRRLYQVDAGAPPDKDPKALAAFIRSFALTD